MDVTRAESLTGQLLVASPLLGDPNFDRTVVLVLAHGDHGALGVVLNRPTQLDVDDALPGWGDLAATPGVVFSGGPVERDAVLVLGRRRHLDGEAIVGRIGAVDPTTDAVDLEDEVDAVRVFAGYAGWDAGQLEAELVDDAWFVVPALPADALSEDPVQLWRSVLRRQGGTIASYANFPDDPSAN